MNKRQLLAGLVATLAAQTLLALPAFAASYVDQILAQLRAQGFENIEVETTWLGRARIAAVRGGVNREIVVNPTTGEVLRDLWLSASGGGPRTITIGNESDADHGGNSGDGGGDNGGSGGGNGGSGGGSGEDGDDNHGGEDEHD